MIFWLVRTCRTEHFILVLDDYHRIEAASIQETVAYLIEHLPPLCHLVILTRANPPSPVARWRSLGKIIEIREDDLRFHPEESAEYLNQIMQLSLNRRNSLEPFKRARRAGLLDCRWPRCLYRGEKIQCSS